jgi:hypothetical protein
MIDLKKIQHGRVALPPRVLFYGFDGVGKTTAACGSPDPLAIDFNRGSTKFDVARVSPASFSEACEWLTAIEKGDVKASSVVVDSLSEMEMSSHVELFQGTSLEDFGGGYGRGQTHAVMKWREVLAQLDRIWLQGKAIVLIAHTAVRKFDDPTGPAYERFEPSLQPKLAGLVRQWVDYVLFCREEVIISKAKTEKTKGVTTNIRYAYTRRCPAFDAKARGSSLFPERILLGWQPLMDAIAADEARSTEMRGEIDAMLVEVGDIALTKKVTEWLRSNPTNVVETHNRVKEILETKKSTEVPATDAKAAQSVAAS